MKTNTIDPKYFHGGGEGWMEEQESDTPRTDAAIELDGITNDHVVRALRIFGREKMTKDVSLESWIKLGADRLEKSKAEVERLRSQLKRAVEIAEEFWNNQKQAVTVYHEELADELAALKKEIK
jgi:hypothetical protein